MPARRCIDPPAGHSNGRSPGLAAVAVVAVLLAVLPSPSPRARAVPPPPAYPAVAARQCGLGFGAPRANDPQVAAALLAGHVDLGQYGWFQLAAHPTWQPVATLDSSGNEHMHSLYYLLPLLREGMRTGDAAMLARFYGVLAEWVRANPPTAPTPRLAWNDEIVLGFRAMTLVCAASGPQAGQTWLRQALVTTGSWLADPRHYAGVNNVSLHQSMGLLAIGVTLARPAWERLAVARMAALAARLVLPDGSDGEGAPAYAVDNYQWLQLAAERISRAGIAVPPAVQRYALLPGFVAQLTRPDFRLEALGDTSPVLLDRSVWAATAAEWPASRGTAGTPPAATFAVYPDGGYVVGRTGWSPDATFYSVRAGRRYRFPHAHDDAGSVTLFAHGSPLLLDTGQWRYQAGAFRSFVVSRAAHDVVAVAGVARSSLPAPTLAAAQQGPVDLVTVVDRGYRRVTLTRVVAYDRSHDVLVVWDRLAAGSAVKAAQQWLLGRDRQVTVDGDVASTSGPGANVTLLFAGGGATLDVATGQTAPLRGWSSQAYGELAPAPSLHATGRGAALSWVTVIVPRAAGATAQGWTASAAADSSSAVTRITSPSGEAWSLRLSGGLAQLGPPDPPQPPAIATSALVARSGSGLRVWASGLIPGETATLEAESGAGFEPVVPLVAGSAGTASVLVAARGTTTWRVRGTGGISAGVTVRAGLPPAAPPVVTVTATGGSARPRHAVTARWATPPSDGGLPITGYVVTVGRRTAVVLPDRRAALLTALPVGAASVRVAARNALGVSPAAVTRVVVPR